MLFNPILCTGCGRCDSCFLGRAVFVSSGFCFHLRDNVLNFTYCAVVTATDAPPFSLCLCPCHARHGGSHRRPPPGPVHHQGERHQCKQGEPRQRHRSRHRVQEVPTAHAGEEEEEGEEKGNRLHSKPN